MSVKIEVKRVANDNAGYSYLVTATAKAAVCGVLRPCIALGARDKEEALGLAGNLLATLPLPTAVSDTSQSELPAPANSNGTSANAAPITPTETHPAVELVAFLKDRK